MADFHLVLSALDLEQARDLRRSVLCGELNWAREAVDDGADAGAEVALALEAGKPAGTARLLRRERAWVDLLAVLPRLRRRGLASGLLALLQERARGAGADELWALAPPSAEAFFRAAGFSDRVGEGMEGVLLFRKPLG